MKNRHISLYSYIAFLFIMYGVWHLTIQSKKHGGYNVSELPDLISALQNAIKPQITFNVLNIFTQEEMNKFNETIHQKYSEFEIEFNIVKDIHQNQDKNGLLINIQKAQYTFLFIQKLDKISIVTQDLNDPSIFKNLRRYLNKFYPLVEKELQLESRQFYTNRLLIFDFYIIEKQNDSLCIDVTSDIEMSVLKLQKYFGLSPENIRINYKFLDSFDFQIIQKKINLQKQTINNFLDQSKQQNNMNWKEYFQMNILTILTDEDVNIDIDSSENVQFFYSEPSNFMIQVNQQSTLFKNIFNAFIQVLQLEEQQEIMIENQDFKPSLELIRDYFQRREFSRHILNFIKELQYIQFIQSEGEYKISLKSQKEFEHRLKYIKDTLQSKNVNRTDSVNILIDDSFSDLDTFSFEYTLGMYLPLILPFAYPILLSIYDELSSN
ncbi:unnamed protein product (macronuclear) [Paramecium tetraurelia]|uniref:Transmembrane protein n=1 Tax=Paramecium tetraurelia TaxID=5888 RepID=A0EAN0_PARTE|nr:uncharacterized protein GSPATT00025081001 [Paramecium tetraurelia]CAK92347.1 unnamed protein product [Paramecium tetraurelia]|eukprot:XP_001459744.1 hypothetical protein (macronuclear) [Paramecium tetraurelia strain d4-2]